MGPEVDKLAVKTAVLSNVEGNYTLGTHGSRLIGNLVAGLLWAKER